MTLTWGSVVSSGMLEQWGTTTDSWTKNPATIAVLILRAQLAATFPSEKYDCSHNNLFIIVLGLLVPAQEVLSDGILIKMIDDANHSVTEDATEMPTDFNQRISVKNLVLIRLMCQCVTRRLMLVTVWESMRGGIMIRVQDSVASSPMVAVVEIEIGSKHTIILSNPENIGFCLDF